MSFVPLAAALEVPRRKRHVNGGRSIYAIFGADGRVRYVGVTRKSLPRRLAEHVERPTSRAMRAWLAGDVPGIQRLEYVTEAEWEDAERGWIHWFRERGELLNVDQGGQARTLAGRLRPFVAGDYVQAAEAEAFRATSKRGFPRSRLWRPMSRPSILQSPTKAPVGERVGVAVYVRRPRESTCEVALKNPS